MLLLGTSILLSIHWSYLSRSFLVNACRYASNSSIIISSFLYTSHYSSPSSHLTRSILLSISLSKYIRRYLLLLKNFSVLSYSTCFSSLSLITRLLTFYGCVHAWVYFRATTFCNASCFPTGITTIASLLFLSRLPRPLS